MASGRVSLHDCSRQNKPKAASTPLNSKNIFLLHLLNYFKKSENVTTLENIEIKSGSESTHSLVNKTLTLRLSPCVTNCVM